MNEVFNIYQACHAVLNNPALKFATNDPDKPGVQYMLYADKSFWTTDDQETETFFDGEIGICLRTNNRYTGSALIIDKKTAALLFKPYEGTLTDFVSKVFYMEESPDKFSKELFPILSIDESDIDNVKASLTEGSRFKDAKTGKLYEVTRLSTTYHNAPEGTDVVADAYTYKSRLYEPYEVYDAYMHTIVYVKEVEAKL